MEGILVLNKTALFLAVLIFSGSTFAGPVRSVAVFTSEKIMGQQIKSFFSSIGKGAGEKNECENAIAEKLEEKGFSTAALPCTEEKVRSARRLGTVFERYSNIGMMPNDIAAQAAGILEGNAPAVIVCGVTAAYGKKEELVCADIECKAVDVKSKRRVAAVAFEKCLPRAEGFSGGVAAIREVCLEAGVIFAEKINERYKDAD